MLLRSPNIQLLPFSPKYWGYLAKWFYDSNYRDMWRHHPKALFQQEFENYPRLIGGEVFMIFKLDTEDPIGFVQIIPDHKTNRGFFLGLVVDKEFQKQQLPCEIVQLVFNYAFNRMGYRKAIIEVCEKNESLNKILLKMNFIHEGKLIGESFQNGEFINENRYCMLASFFNKNHKQTVESWDQL